MFWILRIWRLGYYKTCLLNQLLTLYYRYVSFVIVIYVFWINGRSSMFIVEDIISLYWDCTQCNRNSLKYQLSLKYKIDYNWPWTIREVIIKNKLKMDLVQQICWPPSLQSLDLSPEIYLNTTKVVFEVWSFSHWCFALP